MLRNFRFLFAILILISVGFAYRVAGMASPSPDPDVHSVKVDWASPSSGTVLARGKPVRFRVTVPCRGYDCRNDKRIWLDFENKIVNPNIHRAEWPQCESVPDDEAAAGTVVRQAQGRAEACEST